MGLAAPLLIPGGIVQMAVSLNLPYAPWKWVFRRETDNPPASSCPSDGEEDIGAGSGGDSA